ncbi:MAG: enoyl-CoA hydratase/isomerase family protein [Micromonosporaceae bacterium]|nr:enoyl-CoA hydratase/isomerase family protein [Micromonosporaceae bacterium]
MTVLIQQRRGPVLIAILNRPDKGNSLNSALIDALDRLVRDVGDARALVITGAGGKAFSGGADITELDGLDNRAAFAMMRRGQAVFDRIEQLPIAVIAAVNGYALGGGLELAMAADIRVAAPTARFGQPEITLGNIPGWGGTQRLPRLVGPGIATEMILTGEVVDARRAHALGLVNHVAEDCLDTAVALAERIAGRSRTAVAGAKHAIRVGRDQGLPAGLMAEAKAVATCCGTPEQVAAVRAFRDRKRAAAPPSRSERADSQPRTLSIDEAFEFAQRQVRQLVTRAPGHQPAYTQGGRWVLAEDPWAPSWTGGFLTGMMWAFARRTGDGWWREQAEKYCLLLESRQHDRTTHDLGFVLEPSFGRWYDMDGAERARDVLIQGGRTLAARLRPAGGYLSTWVDPGSTFIDIMANVGLIFRAAEYSGDDELAQIALRHCRTSRRYLVRGDGSTVHEGWFDTTTGEFLRAATHQGWRSDSTWARGQAWAIYGFTTAYEHTGDADLLSTAQLVTDYYMAQTPAGTVPPNDWLDPAPTEPYETSAAAIAAAGMLRLAALLAGSPAADNYRRHALATVATLRSTTFLAAEVEGWEGILRHATYHQGNRLGVNESVMWGDYFFVEALELAASCSS